MLAYLFPGQGSQFVGMGADLALSFPEAKAVFDEADDTLGFSLTSLMFGSAEDAEVLATSFEDGKRGEAVRVERGLRVFRLREPH
ncbi:MAG: malonyl CoA-acyl carrier protein transacylase, partial [Bacteroidota bacterium]